MQWEWRQIPFPLVVFSSSSSSSPSPSTDFPCKLLESLLPASHFDLGEDISLCLLGAGKEHLGDLQISSPCGLGAVCISSKQQQQQSNHSFVRNGWDSIYMGVCQLQPFELGRQFFSPCMRRQLRTGLHLKGTLQPPTRVGDRQTPCGHRNMHFCAEPVFVMALIVSVTLLGRLCLPHMLGFAPSQKPSSWQPVVGSASPTDL